MLKTWFLHSTCVNMHVQGRAAIDSFVAGMDGDRARRTKWNGLAAELDAELKIVKVRAYI